jgi:peptidyl-prolyl cis-trans isomerase D
MISAFRRYLDTWLVRGFFLIMVAAFVIWGIGASLTDVLKGFVSPTWVARVGGRTIEAPAFQAEFQQALNQASRNLQPGQEITPAQRQTVGQQVLQRMIGQAAFDDELRSLRIVTPDAAVAQAIRSMPAFKSPTGQFSRAQFESVLANNGLNEARFTQLIRADLARQQVIGAVTAGAAAPATEIDPLYDAEFERRSATMATFPISAEPAPPPPAEAVLQRWYANHPDQYATPEYRRIKVVELSPETLAKDIPITDQDLRDYYDQHKSDYVTVAKRSTEVISTPDQAKAQALAAQWKAGADWAAMQKAAGADGASAISFDDATEAQFPDPALGKAVFAAPADQVSDPVKGALGWFVMKVTKATPGGETPFEQVKAAIRDRVLADKAADLMYDKANKLDNLLGNGTSLDDLPGDLGLAAVTGTLDADGTTPEGQKAPIPGPPELRNAIIAAAFQTQKGEPPHLTEVHTTSTGGSAYYALTVEDITPPGEKPFDTVKQQVQEDWTQAQQRHAAETAAAKMLTAIKGGQSFADAATVAGVTPSTTPLVNRNETGDGMPPELSRVLFGLKKGEPTMVETPDGFIVAVPTEVVEPNRTADPAGYGQARTAINQTVTGDVATLFAQAVRDRANPTIKQANVDQILQP